jgi:hypothetical protein
MDGQERPCFVFFVAYKEMKPPGGGTSLDYKYNNSELTSATLNRVSQQQWPALLG